MNNLAKSWENGGKTAVFHNSSMRQGPALNPRLFIAVLDAMEDKNWENAGVDLGDIFYNLVDLRFADDMLLFAHFGPEVAQLVDEFVKTV